MLYILPSEIGAFFSTEDNPVSVGEFLEFWKSLSNEEKEQYHHDEIFRNVDVQGD